MHSLFVRVLNQNWFLITYYSLLFDILFLRSYIEHHWVQNLFWVPYVVGVRIGIRFEIRFGNRVRNRLEIRVRVKSELGF